MGKLSVTYTGPAGDTLYRRALLQRLRLCDRCLGYLVYDRDPCDGPLRPQERKLNPTLMKLESTIMNHTIHYGHLTVENTESGAARLRYLGYPLRLSPGELRLLCILGEVDPDQTDSEGFISVDLLCKLMNESDKAADALTEEEILAIFFGSHDPAPQKRTAELTAATAAAVIERINRKASAISGRKLIQGKSHHGYRINPYM